MKDASADATRSLTVLIPALNEEANLAAVVRETGPAVEGFFSDYEILIVDDGSTDATGRIADEMARQDPRVRVFHNGIPRGLGFNYRLGAEQGTKEFYVLVPGDNENPARTLAAVFEKAGSADMVVPYVVNTAVRSVPRRILSRSYTVFLNLLFGLRLPYFNGPVLHRRALLAALPPWTHSFAFQAEILVQLARQGASLAVVPIEIRRVQGSVTKAFRLANILAVAGTVMRLFWRLQIVGRLRSAKKGRRDLGDGSDSTSPEASLSVSRDSSGR